MRKWIKFTSEYNEELKMHIMTCKLPDNGERILVSNKDGVVTEDVFLNDGSECYLDSCCDIGTEVIAWMHMPEPYQE